MLRIQHYHKPNSEELFIKIIDKLIACRYTVQEKENRKTDE